MSKAIKLHKPSNGHSARNSTCCYCCRCCYCCCSCPQQRNRLSGTSKRREEEKGTRSILLYSIIFYRHIPFFVRHASVSHHAATPRAAKESPTACSVTPASPASISHRRVASQENRSAGRPCLMLEGWGTVVLPTYLACILESGEGPLLRAGWQSETPEAAS